MLLQQVSASPTSAKSFLLPFEAYTNPYGPGVPPEEQQR